MSSPLAFDPYVGGIILLMAVATALTKIGGFWLLNRVEVNDRVEAGLSVLPGAIVLSILAPKIIAGGPAEWTAAGITAIVMARMKNILLALCVGVITVIALRTAGL
jgi:uncharacterized membrane protein